MSHKVAALRPIFKHLQSLSSRGERQRVALRGGRFLGDEWHVGSSSHQKCGGAAAAQQA